MMPSGFKIGKCYRHSDGEMIQIVGSAKTMLYGFCLVAESSNICNLKPVGSDIDASVNWTEIPESEWLKNFSF